MKPLRAALLAVTAGLLLASCTDEVNPPEVASAGSPTMTATRGSAETEFVACMRAEGVADMPDPIPGDTSGRSAVRYALDVMGKGSDEFFQAALDKCQNLLPPPDVPADSAADAQAQLAFAKCMREHGVTDFPDPGPNGHLDVWFAEVGGGLAASGVSNPPKPGEPVVLSFDDPIVNAAFHACEKTLPADGD